MSKVAIATAPRKLEGFVREKQLLPPSQVLVVFHTNPVLKSFPYAFKGCYELKGDLSPVMLKEIFHAIVTVWQKMFFSYKSS